MSTISRALALLGLCLFWAGPLHAQSEVPPGAGENFGDWLLRCAENDAGRCALTQRIVDSESREVVAEVAFGPRSDGADGYAMALSVPDGVELSVAPAFRLDGAEDQSAMTWRVCAQGRCQAVASVTQAATDEMVAAGRGIIGHRKYRVADISIIPISFSGLADGLAALGAK